MIVLGFDTATASTSAGLWLADGRTLTMRDDPEPGEHPGHATRLLAMTGELLARAGVAWSALERIAVGVGPGRFTGLRVGIATARGLAQSLSVELVGVSSLHALAVGAGEQTACSGVLAVIDARRGEAFAGAYRVSDEISVSELAPARALSPDELAGVLARAELADRDRGADGDREADGDHGAGWLAVGDGATRFREELELAGATVPGDDSPLHRVDARAICALGAQGPAAASCEEIVPDYRRRADAEIALEGVAALEA
jgi:tRNA threonylcarbamoyladenosine biosynthesis protein TsaB